MAASPTAAPLIDAEVGRAPSAVARGAYGSVPGSAEAAAASDWAPRSPTQRRSNVGRIAGCAILVLVGLGIGLGVYYGTRSSAVDGTVCSWSDYRLPTGVVPSAYRVAWTPQFVAPYGLSTETDIDVTVVASAAQPCILLHAESLNVLSASIQPTGGSVAPGAAVAIPSWTYDTDNQRVVLQLADAAAPGGTYRLRLTTNGTLGMNNYGVYLSTYKNDSGATVPMVASQFEATYARSAFPCFDEPGYKASFNVTLDGIPQNYTALSNMPPLAAPVPSASVPGTLTQSFAPTPRMSTYLLAVVVGKLVGVSGPCGVRNITCTIYAADRNNNVANLAYALAAATDIITHYERMFALEFPLPKMDMAAIPDFAAGAMENWGLITYRETALLANEATSAVSELQRVAVVVSHELAHQWFGDLVTMDWWNALWLNEGFATRVEYIGVEDFAPGFQITRTFQSSDILVAMRADAFADVQQLTSPVDSSAQIEGMFSSISYSKGGSLLFMLQAFLANQGLPNAYNAAITNYLTAHAFGNAQPSDLWASFANVTGFASLPTQLATYELQPGYAVVTLAWSDPASEATGNGSLVVSQQRHFMSPASRTAAQAAGTADLLYWIPLTLKAEHADLNASAVPAAAAAAVAQQGFSTPVWSTVIGGAGKDYSLVRDGFIKANVNGSSYYRVNYPPSLWRALSAAISRQLAADPTASAPLSPFDRGELVDAVFTFAEGTIFASQGINTAFALGFASGWLPLEQAFEAWIPALYHFGSLSSLLTPDVPFASAGDTSVSPFDGNPSAAGCDANFTTYVQRLIAPAVARLGWTAAPGDTPLTIQLRSSVLSAASSFGVQSVIDQAKAYFNCSTGAAAAPVDVQSVVLASVVRWGGQAEYDCVKVLYQSENDAAVKRRYLSALSATRDRTLLSDLLGFSLSVDVRVGDAVSVITAIAANRMGRDLAWTFVKSNWAGTLEPRYGSGGFDLSALVLSLSSAFQTPAYEADIRAFFAANPVPGASHELSQGLELIGAHEAWAASDAAATCTYLAA